MNEKEYILQKLQEKIKQYNLPEKCEDIPLSNEFIQVRYNTDELDLVDPYAEFYLCKKYFIYFVERYGYFLDSFSKKISALHLHDFQKEIVLQSLLNNRFIIFRKSRQMGLSIVSGLYALWMINFNIAQYVLIVSKTKSDAQEFKEKAMVTYDKLPAFLKTKPTRDGQNMTTLKLVNSSKIIVKAQSADAGRGATPSLIILDEAAFMPYADDIWSSVFPSLSVSKGQCIIISTTNGVGNFYHKMWVKAEDGENDFCPVYIPWWRYPDRDNEWLIHVVEKDVAWIEGEIGTKKSHEIKKTVTKELLKKDKETDYWQKLLEAFIKLKEKEMLSYKGDREEKPWLKTQKDNASSVRKFNQEVLSKFLGSGNTVVDAKTLTAMESQIRTPIYRDSLKKDNPIKGLNILENPIEGLAYTLLSDVASGSGLDYSTFLIFRDDTLEQVAEFKLQLDTKKMGKIIKEVARYYNNAYVVIETNQGLSVFNEVYLHDKDPYQNVYFELKNKAFRGFHTKQTNRKLMVDEFTFNLENDIVKIYGKRAVDELKVFIWHNGKAQASKGYNDDLVIPIMMLSYLMKYGGRNIKPLGFATAKQTIGMNINDEDIAKESEYTKEVHAKEQVKQAFGLDWETYQWLTK